MVEALPVDANYLADLERQIAELRASGHDSFKLACMWQDQANAAEADKARLSEALQRAEQAFEEIRLILIYNLHDSERYAFWKAVSARDAVRAALSGSGAGGWRETPTARTLDDWHEDDGFVIWWTWQDEQWLGEPSYIGSPLCSDWPGYHTHWTPHPDFPAAPTATGGREP